MPDCNRGKKCVHVSGSLVTDASVTRRGTVQRFRSILPPVGIKRLLRFVAREADGECPCFFYSMRRRHPHEWYSGNEKVLCHLRGWGKVCASRVDKLTDYLHGTVGRSNDEEIIFTTPTSVRYDCW